MSMTLTDPLIFSLGLSAAGRTDLVLQPLQRSGNKLVANGPAIAYAADDWTDLGGGGYAYGGTLPDGSIGADAWSSASSARVAFCAVDGLRADVLATKEAAQDAADSAAAAATAATAALAAAQATVVTITPLTATISKVLYGLDALTIAQASAPQLAWTVTDAQGGAVNLQGRLVRLVVTDEQAPDVGLYQYDTTAGGIVVSGDGHNVVTVTFNAGDTASPGVFLAWLWDITGATVLRKVRITVEAALQQVAA